MELDSIGAGRFRASNVTPDEHHEQIRTVVFGGQLMGQMIVAATQVVTGKRPLTVHSVFSRAAKTTDALEVATDVSQDGRSLATVAVDFTQDGRSTCRGLVTLDAGDEDLIRHAEPMPDVEGPADAVPVDWAEPGSEVRVVGGVDLASAAATGGPEVQVWVRFPDAPADPALNQALAAWYTDMFMMGAAMRPHDGVGFEVAHERISTGVLSHTLVFHEPCDVTRWFLVTQRATYSGRGRYYGVGSLYNEEGELFGSFSQAGLVRALPTHYGDNGRDKAMVM
jgi:acyl-CoA thioesterase